MNNHYVEQQRAAGFFLYVVLSARFSGFMSKKIRENSEILVP
jgi:hypothetical protein